MSVHSAKFEAQIADSLKDAQNAAREAERARNPFRLTDAGVTWLIWLPVAVLVIGFALILGELNYVRMASIYLPSIDPLP